HAELRAVTEVRLDQLGAIPDGDDQIVEALQLQALDDLLEDRLLADRQQRLRDRVRQRAQTDALAAREDHRLHRAYSRGRNSSRCSLIQSAVRCTPSSSETSGRHPARRSAFELSECSRDTSLFAGRTRCSSPSTSSSRPTIRPAFSTISRIVTSYPEPAFKTSPIAASAPPIATNAPAVSVTYVKSRVVSSRPRRSGPPEIAWVRIVGI